MKKLAFSLESVGQYGTTIIEIFIDINRELTQTDDQNIRKAGQQIYSALFSETLKNNDKIKSQAEEERVALLSLFGYNAIYVEEIPNGYSDDEYFRLFPWFIVTTKIGKIKIGWRKRVINIDWSESDVVFEAEDIFPTEDTTKGERYIHAWGYEKAKQYIDILLTQN